MNEIMKIVLNANKERRILSDDEVKRICHIILNMGHHKLPYEIDFFPILTSDPECGAECLDKRIFFFRYGIEQTMEYGYQSLVDHLKMDGAKIDIYNYYYLFAIFHELAHARQHYLINFNPKKYESRMYKICQPYILQDKFYDENHNIFPTEINANNLAGLTVCNLYSKMPKEYVSDNDVLSYRLLTLQNMFKEAYEIYPKQEDVLSPSEKFLQAICDFDEPTEEFEEEFLNNPGRFCDMIFKIDNKSLYHRIMLGLPISYQEYAYTNLLYQEMEAGENINFIKKLQKKPNSTKS